MAPVLFAVDMAVHSPREVKKIKEELMELPGVVEVCASLVLGHVGIIGMADPATLGELLASELGRPVFLVRDFGAAPAPPVGSGYGVMMPPPSPAPSSLFPAPPMVGGAGGPPPPYGYRGMPPPWLAPGAHHPAPPVGGYYNPYVRHDQLRHATPPAPNAGYCYTPFGGRPSWGPPQYPRNDVPAAAATNEDEGHNGCCCSIPVIDN